MVPILQPLDKINQILEPLTSKDIKNLLHQINNYQIQYPVGDYFFLNPATDIIYKKTAENSSDIQKTYAQIHDQNIFYAAFSAEQGLRWWR